MEAQFEIGKILLQFVKCDCVFAWWMEESVEKSRLVKWSIPLPPVACSPRVDFAVAWIWFSFPKYLYYFLTIQKVPEGKWVNFL